VAAGRAPGKHDDRIFRPLWATLAAAAVGTMFVAGTLFVGFTAVGPGGGDAPSRWAFTGLAAAAGALAWRLGGVFARPSERGLVVRNVVRTRRLEWAEIVAVRLMMDDPWVVLDLSDGTTLAVMAIQRSDGRRGMREATRLAALVRARGEATDRGE
jgi:hypothetical protein